MIAFESVGAIAWDLDGTILDSQGVFSEVVTRICEEDGVELFDPLTLQQNFHGSLEDTLRNLFKPATDEDHQQLVGRFLGHQDGAYDDIEKHLFQDALELVVKAAKLGIPQLIITNRAHEDRGSASPLSIVERTVLGAHIDEVRYYDDGRSAKKPNPESIADWLDYTGAPPEGFIVVGDQVVDAQLALNVGGRAVLVRRGEEIHHLEKLPKNWREHVTIVDSLHEVQLAT